MTCLVIIKMLMITTNIPLLFYFDPIIPIQQTRIIRRNTNTNGYIICTDVLIVLVSGGRILICYKEFLFEHEKEITAINKNDQVNNLVSLSSSHNMYAQMKTYHQKSCKKSQNVCRKKFVPSSSS